MVRVWEGKSCDRVDAFNFALSILTAHSHFATHDPRDEADNEAECSRGC